MFSYSFVLNKKKIYIFLKRVTKHSLHFLLIALILKVEAKISDKALLVGM